MNGAGEDRSGANGVVDPALGLAAFVQPVLRVCRLFVPMHSRSMLWGVALGTLGSGMNSLAYVILVPLINHATNQAGTVDLAIIELAATPVNYGLILGGVVASLVLALQANYQVHCLSLDVLRRTVNEAAVRVVLRLHDRLPSGNLNKAVNEVSGRASFACGFVMRQVVVGVADALQLAVFLTVLFWIHPGLTLAFSALAVATLPFFAHSLARVTRSMAERQPLSAEARKELKWITDTLKDGEVEPEHLRQHMEDLHEKGAPGGFLENKLDLRREMRRGPMVVESLFPVALVVLPLLALATGAFQDMAAWVIVYALVLRNVIGLLQRLAGQLITVGRFFPPLLCYLDVMDGAAAPRCAFTGEASGTDGEEET